MTLLFLLVIAAGSIIYSTLRLGISPMPSHPQVQKEIKKVLPNGFSGTFVEIGAGWGGIANSIAKTYPEATVIALERSVVPFLFMKLRSRKNVDVRFHDYRQGIPPGAYYYTYLFPRGMSDVKKHLSKRGGTVISYAFALPFISPHHVMYVGSFIKTPLYVYRLE